jgi:hypothetical protein
VYILIQCSILLDENCKSSVCFQCYSRDVTLLAGTAVAMVMNAASAPEETVACFISLYSGLTGGR